MYGEDIKASVKQVRGGYSAYVSRTDDGHGYDCVDEVPISGEVIGKDLEDLLKNIHEFLDDHGCKVKITGLTFGWDY